MLLLLLPLACLVTSSPLNTDYQDDYPDNYDQTGVHVHIIYNIMSNIFNTFIIIKKIYIYNNRKYYL